MAFIRSIEHIANKFATVTPQRTEDYRIGVQNPRKDWATSTAAAESAYETGVRCGVTVANLFAICSMLLINAMSKSPFQSFLKGFQKRPI